MQSKQKMVKVDWVDSSEWNGWRDDIKDMKPSICTTIGYLRSDCKAHIIVASSKSDNSHCSHMVIPRGCITKIKELKEDDRPSV